MANKNTNSEYPMMSLDEIMKRIESAKGRGRKARWFFLTQISKDDYEHLKKEGYKIHSPHPITKSSFKISW